MKKFIGFALFLLGSSGICSADMSFNFVTTGGTITYIHTNSVALAGQRFVTDTFTDSNDVQINAAGHVGETGASWVNHSSYTNVHKINSNRAVTGSAASAAMSYASGVPPYADYDVDATVRVLSQNFNSTGNGIVCRSTVEPENTMIFARYSSSGYQVFQNTAGTSLQIGTSSSTAVTTGQDYAWKLSCIGTSVTLSIDGTTVVSGTTTVTAAGRVGIRGVSASSTTGIAIADISATTR